MKYFALKLISEVNRLILAVKIHFLGEVICYCKYSMFM